MRPRAAASALLLLLPALALAAQTGDGRDFPLEQVNPGYDGRFTFTRVRYGGPGFFGRGGSTWSHDYPDADRNMHRILDFLTSVRVHRAGTNVFTLDDPEIFRNPILYLSEPGFWSASDGQLQKLRAYLLKGGFLILDDFEQEQWFNMESNLKRALPEHAFRELPADHAVFQTLLRIENIYVLHPFMRIKPRYMGIFEDDDPAGRLMVLANHNSDLAEYWEWSGKGYFPVDITNEAYALGVNYILYGLTH